MSEVEITIKLPEELVARARAVGLTIEDRADSIAEFFEQEVKRREAAKRLLEIGDKLSALPDDMKPTDEEVSAARRAYWDAKSQKA